MHVLICLRAYRIDDIDYDPTTQVLGAPHPVPTSIPAKTRDHLSTPLGLLINELLHSPDTLLASIERLVDTAVEMDTGR